jgi:hypothetical protein
VFDFNYRPSALVTNAAPAITNGFIKAFDYESLGDFNRVTCWAHVVMEIDKKLPSTISQRQNILDDIAQLQVCNSPNLFKFMYGLFEKKWSGYNDPKITDFMSYFKTTWIESINSGWYEGFAEKIPSTDNGLESTNRLIKDIYTLRERLAVYAYFNNAFKMIRNWSIDSHTIKPFSRQLKISNETWKLAYNFLISKDSVLQKNGDDFILTKQDKSKFIKKKFIYGNYSSFKYIDFNTAVAYMNVKKVSLNRVEWTESKCTCGFFQKNYICYHVIAVATHQELTDIPIRFKNVPLTQKKKPGRPPKAKKALVKQ